MELDLDMIFKLFKTMLSIINHLAVHLCSVKLQTGICSTGFYMLSDGNNLIHTSKDQILALTLKNLNSDQKL